MTSQDPDPDDDGVTFYAEAVNIHGAGMATIPYRLRERYSMEPYDVVDLIVYTDDVAFQATDIVVQSDGRVRIPDRKRDLYGIEDGDAVDLEVATTGLTFPPEEL